MPETLAQPQSIVIGDAVFVAAYDSLGVHMYETRSDQCSVLPPCPVCKYTVYSGMQEWVIQIPSIPILVSVLFHPYI